MIPPSFGRQERISAALRQISKGLAELADAISADPEEIPESERYRALIAEWHDRGLDRNEASVLFRKHGFAPQAAGGWVRGDWLEIREDGRRYLTPRSLQWLGEQEAGDEQVNRN
ncbi:hypothetical protein [Streptosporangium sp. NPDC000396]|uniref:hypothetical protein n=1 Tax=Streptosporangium sp. NPDC000396 TaxID=3366185 RepID=UPI003676453A